MSYLEFVKENARWLAAGLLLAFASSFGQTFFISLFAAEFRTTFDLSHGELGSIYMFATVASAATLVQLGRLADHMRLVSLGALSLIGLALTCISVWAAASWWMLLVSIYALRLFGQGMMSHVASTAMARWFNNYRGRALGFKSLGYPCGEALFPSLAVLLMLTVGWRQTWLLAAGALILIGLPILIWLLRQERKPSVHAAQWHAEPDAHLVRHWTRPEVLKNPLFYAVMPGVMAPACFMTATFFNQTVLAETKGWSLATFASFYPAYAVASVAAALAIGIAIDRWSARQMTPFFLLPMAVGFFVFALADSPAAGQLAMILFGLTAGSGLTLLSALWAELYGTRHLGAIRALGQASSVFATAIGPGIMGLLLDRGVGLEQQFYVMGACSIVAALAFLPLMPRMRRAMQPL